MLRDHSKTFAEEERGGGRRHWKANKNEQGEEGGRPSMCVRSLLKKMLRFSKWSSIIILQFFILIIMAVWNIKQSIMKDDNIQSCHWMTCDRFREPLLLCTTFCSFLCTILYFFCAFSAKMAIYSLVVDVLCDQ